MFPCHSTLPIRMRQFGIVLAYHVSQRSQVHGPILGAQVVSAHSPWFQTDPLGVCVSLFAASSIVWSTCILTMGLLEPSWTKNPPCINSACTTRISRYCHFHLWRTWCRLQTVPWYTYMNRSQGPASGMLALRLDKCLQWSSKFHPCGQDHRTEWLPAMTGNPCCCCGLLLLFFFFFFQPEVTKFNPL